MRFSFNDKAKDAHGRLNSGNREILTTALYDWYKELPEKVAEVIDLIRVQPANFGEKGHGVEILIKLQEEWASRDSNFRNSGRELSYICHRYVFTPENELTNWHYPDGEKRITRKEVMEQLTSAVKERLKKELECCKELQTSIKSALDALK